VKDANRSKDLLFYGADPMSKICHFENLSGGVLEVGAPQNFTPDNFQNDNLADR
jgi:hypothetical protein